MGALSNLFNAIKNKPSNLLFTLGYAFSTFYMYYFVGMKQGNLFVLGSALGLVLYQTSFGFTAGFTHIIKNYRNQQLRAQMLMLMAASIIMLPILADGEINGQAVSGKITASSTAMAAGAFIFGVGMQLGNGCASGTLAYLGSGSLRMGITLTGFIVGSLLGTFHVPWWNELPSLGKISNGPRLGIYVCTCG